MNLRAGQTLKLITILSSLLLTVTLGFSAPGTSVVTVEIVGGGTVKPNYDGQTLTNGNKYSMTAKPRPGFAFTGWSGSLTSSKTKLTFTNAPGQEFTATFVDRQKPTLKITTVPGSSALTTNSFFVSGTARDNGAVTNVLCRLNGAAWTNASALNGWSNWWFTVSLDAGTNLLEACAVDAAGNVSKTNKLKLIYSVAPVTLAGYTLTYVDTNGMNVTFDFGTNGFTDVAGVGTYIYKKTSSIFGRINLAYSAPPSAVNQANNGAVLLQFTSPTDGTFTDAEGLHAFSLAPDNGWAPPTLNNSTITLIYDDGVNQTSLGFYEPPLVVTNGSTALPNPLLVPLDSDYPGQFGDRVKVSFSRLHYVSQFNTWVQYPTQEFIGTVIDIGSGAVTVLFDSPPKSDKANIYALIDGAPLNIVTCTYDTQLTNDTATFSFTNTSPDGALLHLNPAGSSQYVVMNFTNDSDAGLFYEEDYDSSTNPPVIRSGIFMIALAPQIAASPTSVAVTNGGTASFTVKASGTPPLSFQWQLNGNNLTDGLTGSGSTITGAATTNLIVSGVSTNDAGSYRAVVTNNLGSATSSAATLTIAAAPQISSQPVNSFPTNGGTATFSVTATGSLPLAYQWQVNGTNLNNGVTAWNSVISGALTTNLTISAVSTNDSGFYQVIVTNSFGSVTSTPALLDVSP